MAMNIEWNGDSAELGGFTLTRTTEQDDNQTRPWENEDGHGPVRATLYRNAEPSKAPGELILAADNGHAWIYDYAEACRIARKDGWGWLPEPLRIIRDKPSEGDGTTCGGEAIAGSFRAYDPDDFNKAISSVYAQHRKSMTPKAYAAEAARRDFERLRQWCANDWNYVGVIVTVSKAGVELGHASLWGIESDAGDYLDEVSVELAEEALDSARDTLGELCDCDDEEAE